MRRVAIITVWLAASMLSGAQSSVTVAGYLTDTLCGARGANHLHAEHARRSVATGKAQYALYDERTRQLYILADRAAAEQWLGQRVRITGTVSATPIRRSGQSYAPDTVATVTVNGEQRPVSGNPSRTSAAPADAMTPRVQSHERAADTATPVAGVLAITSIESLSGREPSGRRTTRPRTGDH